MTILCRYSEIGLKGKNRSMFEKRLVSNIKYCLEKNNIEYSCIRRVYGRILIETENDCSTLRRVFGITTFSNAVKVDADVDMIADCAMKRFDFSGKTFCVRCQRLDKSFKKTSLEIEKEVGERIFERTKSKVSLKNPEVKINLEIIEGNVYLMASTTECFGGLPLGIEGKVHCLVEDEASILAALLMMKRGCCVIPVMLEKKDITLLKEYSYGCKIEEKFIKDLSEVKDLVVVGQTLENFKERGVKTILPLISYTKRQIEEELDGYRKL